MDYKLRGMLMAMEKLGCIYIRHDNKTIEFNAPETFTKEMQERAARPFTEWYKMKVIFKQS
jgi:hypothetical protein